jgi:hypothetical protein
LRAGCRDPGVRSDVLVIQRIAGANQQELTMKYVILIHANPNPWGHPTGHYTDEGRLLDDTQRAAMDHKFDELMETMSASGELIVCEALADPASSTIYRWEGNTHVATDGPYAETKEHLAGFFLVDVESRERAEEIGATFAHPGDVIELRPAMWAGGPDA